MNVILANYGNDSIALIQWAFEAQLQDVFVMDMDTGWAAPEWALRVQYCQAWVASLGFTALTLHPKATFAELIQQQGFPSRKFQWCASFLKGLPLLAWLDEPKHDPHLTATILIAHRRSASRARFNLPEFVAESEHFGERRLWHPLYLHTTAERNALVARAGFSLLSHRSLECDPCVNSDIPDVLRMDLSVIERTAALEKTLNQHMLDDAIYQQAPDLLAALASLKKPPLAAHSSSAELFDMGCGAPYGCGL